MKFNPKYVALATGLFVSGWHLLWSLLVVCKLAQPLLNWVFKLHFINPVYVVGAFNFWTALALIIFTFIVGYVFGYLAALVWNKIVK